MKRVLGIWAIVAATLFCLCGCGTTATIDPITDGFSAETTIRYKEMDVQGRFSCSADGRVSMVFALPKSLEGVTLGWNGSEMQMGLGGMTVTVAKDSMPDGGLILQLARILASVNPKDGTREGADYVIRGTVEGADYTLVCEAVTGFPKTLSVPDAPLEVTFSQVSVI